MEIRVVDFDVLTKNYTKYQDGMKNLTLVRESFVRKMDPIKEEMEFIVKAANSGLIVDPNKQQEQNAKFAELQDKAMAIDNEYKVTIRTEQDNLNKKTYEELSTIITGWTEGKGIDLVMGKMEVVWASTQAEITNSILDILKERNEYSEYKEETQTENVENVENNVAVEDLR